MDTEKKLQYKIELWNRLTDLLNDRKGSVRTIGNLFVGIGLALSVVNVIFDHTNNDIVQKIMNIVYLVGLQ